MIMDSNILITEIQGGIKSYRITRIHLFTSEFQVQSNKEGALELIVTLLPYSILVVLGTYLVSTKSYVYVAPVSIISALFIVRLFMILHDCSHRSFLSNSRWNDWVGRVLGLLTLTPFTCWRRFHAMHHATSGNLDKRGMWDVWTLTVREYRDLGYLGKLKYRLYRSPISLFIIGPIVLFAIRQRMTYYIPCSWREAKYSVYKTNAALIALLIVFHGFNFATSFIMFYIVTMVFASSIGVWLFYVQHQFESSYWVNQPNWNHRDAALMGSSYYKLPKIIEWLTANIGYHHIHHLNTRIPYYRLVDCYQKLAGLQEINILTFRESLKCASLKLWDEDRKRMVKFWM